MANYQYDEGGYMAAYFLITLLVIILVPLTFSLSPNSKRQTVDSCQCKPCLDQRARIQKREQPPLLLRYFSMKAMMTAAGWSLFIYLVYKTAKASAEHKVYDPFEVLGLTAGITEKEIKSHYKKLSKLFHPDKVKPTVNLTADAIANKFVELTKAYKSLTDENIRKNWELYGHPDGRQETTVGIALPKWIIKGKNNVWVLGFYGIAFGGALPVLVGRWWFGSRQKTKDGIQTSTAAAFFKSIREESEMEEVVGCLARAFEFEPLPSRTTSGEMGNIEYKINTTLGAHWASVKKFAGIDVDRDKAKIQKKERALILIYAHLLRIPVIQTSLQGEQTALLLQMPNLLSALLTTTVSRNWLPPVLSIMRLYAYLAQALPPLPEHPPSQRFAQLPGIELQEIEGMIKGHTTGSLGLITGRSLGLRDFLRVLEKNSDGRIEEVRKAMGAWGKIELVDASFKVIGERLVTPSAIVLLVVKLRMSSLADETKATISKDPEVADVTSKANDEKDYQFLIGRQDVEELPVNTPATGGWAHTPYWPENRKPGWWLVLADDKLNRIVVPPFKITDVPLSNPSSARNYRSYKLQFQAPQTVGLFTWKVCLISDTYVGDEVFLNLVLNVSAMSPEEKGAEDEISDPEEGTLAGQMAIMRGGGVKRVESDEESDTDDNGQDDADSSSDSD